METQTHEAGAAAMTDHDLNRAVALARGHKVEKVEAAWDDFDWLTSDSPSARNVYAIINEAFRPGSMDPPAWVLPDICSDPAAWGALLEEIAAAGLEPELKHSVHGDWSVWIYEGPRGAAQARASDPTLGRALAKAFLASKGVEAD